MINRELFFAGGDKRRLYTERYFANRGYDTVSYEKNPEEFLKKLESKNAVVILPLPFTRDGESVNPADSGKMLKISELLSKLKKGDKVIGGMLSEDFKSALSAIGAQGLEYYCEELISENAELTADAVFEVLKEQNIDIFNMKTAITGFGRTAKAIAERFDGKKLDFTVTARSSSAENDAVSRNYKYVKLSDFTQEIQEFDVIINTVPALILNESLLKKAKSSLIIVDIASAPFGVEKTTAQALNIKLIRALGLPGKYYPEKAGELIGKKAEILF